MKTPKRKLTAEQWEQCRIAHYGGVPLRELARRLAIPAGTILARAKREGWGAQLDQAQNAIGPLPAATETPLVSAADAVLNVLSDDSRETRLSLSRYARKAALAAEQSATPLREAQAARHVAGVAAQVHGWEASEKASTDVHVNVCVLRDPDAFGPA